MAKSPGGSPSRRARSKISTANLLHSPQTQTTTATSTAKPDSITPKPAGAFRSNAVPNAGPSSSVGRQSKPKSTYSESESAEIHEWQEKYRKLFLGQIGRLQLDSVRENKQLKGKLDRAVKAIQWYRPKQLAIDAWYNPQDKVWDGASFQGCPFSQSSFHLPVHQ